MHFKNGTGCGISWILVYFRNVGKFPTYLTASLCHRGTEDTKIRNLLAISLLIGHLFMTIVTVVLVHYVLFVQLTWQLTRRRGCNGHFYTYSQSSCFALTTSSTSQTKNILEIRFFVPQTWSKHEKCQI